MRTKFGGALLCAFAMLLYMTGLAVPVFADEPLGSITLVCESDDIVMSGMNWNIYHIGSHNEADEFVLEGDFADCPVSFDDLSASAVQQAANDLEDYAISGGIEPLYSASADENGGLLFDGLEKGLYLLTGEPISVGGYLCTPAAAVVEVTADENGSYDLTVYPKFELSEDSRPDSSAPDSSVPDSSSSDSTGTGSAVVSQPSTSTSTSTPEKIPQTGQLWWPVPIMAVAGIALVVVGWRLCSKKENDE